MTKHLMINGQQPGFFFKKSAIEIQQSIKKGKYTATQMTEMSLADIDRLNPSLNAFVAVNKESALQQAYELDRKQQQGLPLGSLHGLPIAISDMIFTKGLPTTAGSAFNIDDHQKIDADCITKLREAGAIIIGKTLTHEFAYGSTGDRSFQGATCNPWDITRMSGGSSAGSACAIAAGLLPLAIGTDTGGAIRIPSALCGVVGFKPSYNSINMKDVFPLAKTFDHIGPIANNVADINLTYQVIKETNFVENNNVDLTSTPKFLWLDSTALGLIDETILEKTYQWAKKHFGKMRDDPTVDMLIVDAQSCYQMVQSPEAYAIHMKRVLTKPELFDTEILSHLQKAADVKGWEYSESLEFLKRIKIEMNRHFESFDFIVMPTVGITAPQLQARDTLVNDSEDFVKDLLYRLTNPWNALGLPAISIPIGFYKNLPIGLQIIAKYGNDSFLLNTLMKYIQ